MALIRLNKLLAQRGFASRRAADQMIADGLVSVNGKVVREMGVKVDPGKDEVKVGKVKASAAEPLVYLMLHKPLGVVASSKPTADAPQIVMDLVKIPQRVFSVGRLDKDSSGLLILTNDGDLALKLTHPSHETEKEYDVTVENRITPEVVHKLEQGVRLWEVRTNPAKVEVLSHNRMRLTITEGKNRQIRRICQKIGIPVISLKRIRVKDLTLGNLAPGKWRYLTETEVRSLKS